MDHLQKTLALVPAHGAAHFLAAQCAYAMGDFRSAAHHAQSALQAGYDRNSIAELMANIQRRLNH